MNTAIKEIDLLSMGLAFLLLLIPVTLAILNRINIVKELSIGVIRMSAQLCAMGLLLQFMFKIENAWLTTFWLLVMIGFANMTLIRRLKIKTNYIVPYTFFPLFLGSGLTLAYFIIVTVRPEPMYSARYLVTIFGMLIGNSMNGNILALERFYISIKKGKKEYLTYLSLGASPKEACHDFFTSSYRASLTPIMATMATMGIVALPGMMTGQILGGVAPLAAIKYQIGIIIAIFTSISLSSILLLISFRSKFFDENGVPKKEIFG